MKAFFHFISERFGRKGKRMESGPVSIVMLMREPCSMGGHEIAAAADRVWGSNADNSGERLVEQSANKAVLYIAPHLISILSSNRPYFGRDPELQGKELPQLSQQKAWAQHRAWIALDYIKGGRDLQMEYGVLARLVAEIVDLNCSGIYIPREGSFIPNDGSLKSILHTIADKAI